MTRPRPVLLGLGTTVHVAGSPTTVQRVSGTDDKPILRLEVTTTREAVLALRGEDLLVARADAPALPDGEFWAEDLAGCLVVDGDVEVGVVVRMLPLPSCEALEVRRGGTDEPDLLVPMVRDAVRTIDIPGRRVDVDLAFLDLQDA